MPSFRGPAVIGPAPSFSAVISFGQSNWNRFDMELPSSGERPNIEAPGTRGAAFGLAITEGLHSSGTYGRYIG